jgi:hypothetical protein
MKALKIGFKYKPTKTVILFPSIQTQAKERNSPFNMCLYRVQIQKEVIHDLKRENQFLSKEII